MTGCPLNEIEMNMKTALRVSIWLNLGLLAGLFFILLDWRKPATVPGPALSDAGPPVAKAAIAPATPPPAAAPEPFHWSQLEAPNSYQTYIANLRAIGCPEPTIEDIVRGDAARTFSWERSQLGLDGSGAGPWSRSRELQLVASLLGGQPMVATKNRQRANNGGEVARTSVSLPSPKTGPPAYPLFLQNPDWKALGFSADEQAAISQVRQQFQSEVGSLNQSPGDTAGQNADATSADGSPPANPNDSSALAHWQQALQSADNQLRGLLGAQGYMAYEQQQYYAWYQPQVVAAAASGGPLAITPEAFSPK